MQKIVFIRGSIKERALLIIQNLSSSDKLISPILALKISCSKRKDPKTAIPSFRVSLASGSLCILCSLNKRFGNIQICTDA